MKIVDTVMRTLGYAPQRERKEVIVSDGATEIPLDDFLQFYSATNSGEYITPGNAMTITAVYACVGRIAETLAQMPIKIYRIGADGGRYEDPSHPLYRLLAVRPNEWQTSFEFREMAAQILCLRGNFYAWKGRDSKGIVRELLPFPMEAVSVRQDQQWNVTYAVASKDKNIITTSKDIMHIKYRTLNGYEGISPIAWNRESLGLSAAALKHGALFFKNGASLKGVLTTDQQLTEEAFNRIKTSWAENYSGDNKFKTPLLESGLKYQSMTMSNEDAQFIQTRQLSVEDIARIYGVPLHEIQANSKTTSWGTGIESMNIGFITRTILPWVRRFEHVLNRDLIPESEQGKVYIKFCVEGLMRGDLKSRYESYQIGINNGFLSPNEVREKEDLNPRDGGDIYLTPLNMSSNQDQDSDNSDDTGKEDETDDETNNE